MATKRIDDATRPVLSALEAGYKVLVDKISGGTKVIDLDKIASKVHTHVKADVSDFTHTHAKADITDFAHTHTLANITDAGTVASLDYWTGTQAAYDLLTKDSNTLYIIIG
jgi:hypothetical protein